MTNEKGKKQKNIECPILNVEVKYSCILYLLEACGVQLAAVFCIRLQPLALSLRLYSVFLANCPLLHPCGNRFFQIRTYK